MKMFQQKIGDYEILDRLGRGGMADVFLAFDSKNDRRVALKLIERGPGDDVEEILAAEQLGAHLQAKLCTIEPRIAQIHSFGDLEGYFYIDMEYIDGKDLAEVIRTAPLDATTAANIARELCDVLRKTHSACFQIDGRELRAVVHGDIKPKNIRIEPSGGVRIVDFGIAKGLSLTRRLTSNVFGSAAYSSPERLSSGRIDEMSDLWSVGVVLYEMVEGGLPFEAACTERLETVIRAHTPLRPLTDRCPAPLQHIICKALAPSPARRYASAEQFGSDLAAYLANQPTIAEQDSDETRRTFRDDDETRRTFQDVEAPDGPVTIAQPAPPKGFTASRRMRRAVLAVLVALPALMLGLSIWEAVVYRSAARLEPQLAAGQLDPDQAWARYQEVKRKSVLGLAPVMLRPPLVTTLYNACQQVADQYRNSDYPRAREGDWLRCRRYMGHAMEVDRFDRKTSAMMEYASGQVARINRRDLEAIADFQRAAALQPRWPDPYLGMARTYIYNLNDAERGMQALKRAEDLGHDFGRKDRSMMADAFKAQGLKAWEASERLRDSDQEKDLLSKAKENLQKALKLYSELAPWGDSANQLNQVEDALATVETRLKEVNPPNPLFPWNWFKR
jgi:eukaryotic-like serine/threonine-protein kinase